MQALSSLSESVVNTRLHLPIKFIVSIEIIPLIFRIVSQKQNIIWNIFTFIPDFKLGSTEHYVTAIISMLIEIYLCHS